MNMVFAYGHDIMATFPNGKSFGVDLAIGKWFSPDFGGRFKLNWVNGIFKNDHNSWLRPQNIPGENHRRGGFITFVGDNVTVNKVDVNGSDYVASGNTLTYVYNSQTNVKIWVYGYDSEEGSLSIQFEYYSQGPDTPKEPK